MIPYYADARKYLLRTRNPVTKFRKDREADQFIHISGTIFGVEIRPGKRWTRQCTKLFRDMAASCVRLEDISCAPDGTLDFINDLSGCKQVSIDRGLKIDLSPLAKSKHIEDVQIGPSARLIAFDFCELPTLRRCQVPLHPEMASLLRCRKLVCLSVSGGRHDGVLSLESLSSLEELNCVNVGKLKGVVLAPGVRLRALELSHLRDCGSVGPQAAISQELRVVELNKVPRLEIGWLAQAKNVECVALRLGGIPTISFLKGLKRLQVLDLFGSKVLDGDLSFRDSLKNELDPKLWGEK